MVEHVFHRANQRRIERQKALADLWEAAQAVADLPDYLITGSTTERVRIDELRKAVERVRARMTKPRVDPVSNPNSPWAQ